MYFCFVKITRTLIFSLLILFTFIGNVGMNVFTHSCKEDGIFRSYFVQLQDHCEDHDKEVVPSCCKKKEVKDKDCCNDELDVFKIKLDFFSQYQVSIPLFFLQGNLNQYTFEFGETRLLSFYQNHFVHPPPKPSGRQILLLNQVFRI